jgi:predicted RNase H-like HicB family nuclease
VVSLYVESINKAEEIHVAKSCIFTGVFVKSGDCYTAYAEELPGAVTQGRTIEEAQENLIEAIELVLEANRELSEKELAESGLSGIEVTRKELAIAR